MFMSTMLADHSNRNNLNNQKDERLSNLELLEYVRYLNKKKKKLDDQFAEQIRIKELLDIINKINNF